MPVEQRSPAFIMSSTKQEIIRLSDSSRTNTERRWVEIPDAFAVNGSRLPEKVFKLRKRLYIKAKQEPRFRFYALYDRICRRDVLEAAWAQVAANNGAPGVDEMSVRDVRMAPRGVQGFVDDIQEKLRTKRYRPSAVRRKMIPKANGGERPLGIPTVRDRVVQTAVKLILEPIFEADFLEVSHGYRPGRSAHDALAAIRAEIMAGRTEVYDADLKGYFDSIPHDKLMACVAMRIADGSVLKLIRQWLRAPIHEPPDDQGGGPTKRYPRQGTPQGGVISALLANVYLHWLDRRFHHRSGPFHFAGARLVRYADDFVVLAPRMTPAIVTWLKATVEDWLGLRIHPDKTCITRLTEPDATLDFVGYQFRYRPCKKGRSGHRYLHVGPSPKACARERDRIRELTASSRGCLPIPKLITDLNRQLRGWARYFDYGYPRPAKRAMNWYICQRLIHHLRRHRSQRAYRPPAGVSFYHHLYRQLGVLQL